MTKEYIEREAARAWLHEEDFGTPDERWRPESEFGALVDALPAADVVEVKHGEWRYDGDFKACSLCGTFVEWNTLGTSHWKYCPYCGAKMDVERKQG